MLWLVSALTFAAFVLRLYRLDFVPLRGDEAFTVVFVQRTWEGLWKGIRLIEPNPPLLYLALRAWVAVAGTSEFVTRYFSAFFGVLCVPLLYRLARELLGRNLFSDAFEQRQKVVSTAAVLAAALIAFNPYQIWHSQDVRNYTMWPALSMLSLIFFWRFLKRDWRLGIAECRLQIADSTSNPQSLIPIFYVVSATASLYTHYYDTFILVAENLFVIGLTLLQRRWGMLARWMAAQCVLAAVYLPWVLFGTDRIGNYGEASAEQSVPLLEQIRRTLTAFVLGDTVPEALKTLLWLPLALMVIGALVYWMRRNRARGAFLALYIVVPTLALYAISLARPLFLERYLNGIAPAYYLLLAIGLELLARWSWPVRGWLARPALARLAAAAPLVVGLAFFGATSAYALANYYFDPAYAKAPDWRSLTRTIVARQQPGDFVIQNYTEMSVIYYLDGALPVVTLPKTFWGEPADEQRLRELNDQYRRLWFVPAAPDFWDPDHLVENFLSRYDDRLLDVRFTGLSLQLYATPPEFQKQIVPVNARVGDTTLVGYRLERTRPLHVVLYWRPARAIAHDYAVFVHLADSGDRVRRQQDRSPVNGTYPTRAWQPGELIVDAYDLPGETEPGVYSLFVGMYDPATLARVPVYDSNGIPLRDDRVLLTQVTIP